MTIVSKDSTLTCHYFPETATEDLSAEYKEVPVAAAFMKSLMFLWGNPRKLSMTLLFNDWGEPSDSNRSSGKLSVADSLDWLRQTIHPSGLNSMGLGRYRGPWGWDNMTVPGDPEKRTGEPPPLLIVHLTDETFFGHLTGMTITYRKLHPSTHKPIRAEVAVEFKQFIPTNFSATVT
jgi:hypothetical protein